MGPMKGRESQLIRYLQERSEKKTLFFGCLLMNFPWKDPGAGDMPECKRYAPLKMHQVPIEKNSTVQPQTLGEHRRKMRKKEQAKQRLIYTHYGENNILQA